MSKISALLIFGLLALCKPVIAQQSQENKRHSAMLKFLYEQKELTNPKDTVLSDLDVMYDRLILKPQKTGRSGRIYLFGTNSAHGKRLIALIDHSGTNFLISMDLPADMQKILDFFKRNHIDGQQLYQSMAEIARAYQYNLNRNFKPAVEDK